MLLLSSAADLYWLGRYLTRGQSLAALLLDCLDRPGLDWLGLPLSITGSWQQYYQQHMVLSGEGIADFFISSDNPSGLGACLQAMRADAQGTRGCISRELWLTINSLWLEWQTRSGTGGQLADHRLLYAWAKGELSRVQQLVDDLALADAARFIRLGQSMEALDYHLRQLATPDMPSPPPEEFAAALAGLVMDIDALQADTWSRVQESVNQLAAQAAGMVEPGRDAAATGFLQAQLQQVMYRLSDAFSV